jgi:hypothetical protein
MNEGDQPLWRAWAACRAVAKADFVCMGTTSVGWFFRMPSRLKPSAYTQSQPALAKKSAKADFVCMGTTSVGCFSVGQVV